MLLLPAAHADAYGMWSGIVETAGLQPQAFNLLPNTDALTELLSSIHSFVLIVKCVGGDKCSGDC